MSNVRQIAKQAETLSSEEQLTLAAILLERVRRNFAVTKAPHRWLDAMGVAPYPLAGEDAQAWVTRSRNEGDAERKSQWRPTS